MASSEGMLSPCERLPKDLLRRVLQRVMRWGKQKNWCHALRGVNRKWRALHDVTCTKLRLRNGITCTRVTGAVLRELRGLTALSKLNLYNCTNVTSVGLRELRGLTALTFLDLNVGLGELRGPIGLTALELIGCTHVTDAGLQHLSCLTALTTLVLGGNSTTRAGQDALKTALPALTIHG